jgi:hypothetical protein
MFFIRFADVEKTKKEMQLGKNQYSRIFVSSTRFLLPVS